MSAIRNVINEDDSKLVFLQDTKMKVRVSNEGLLTINSTIEKINEDYKNSPNNYLRGFFGILIGAILGFVLALILGHFGYISSLAPFISIIFGIFLYKKFGGKQNAVMIIISFITTIIFIAGASLLTYVLTANDLVADAGLIYKGFDALSYCLENSSEFKRFFISDLVLSVVFALFAEGISIYSLIKTIKRPKHLK